MMLNFRYNTQSDIWCLMNYGKSSTNSAHPTAVYKEMADAVTTEIDKEITEEKCRNFISNYLSRNNIDMNKVAKKYNAEWKKVAEIFEERANQFFRVSLSQGIDVELSINNRSPYNVPDGFFFCAVPTRSSNLTCMHELWHFYLWEKYGLEWETKLGKQKYNNIKEALTVLLNEIFQDILDDKKDSGYPQHSELRKEILEIWNSTDENNRNIENMWAKIVALVDNENIREVKKQLK